MTKKYQIKDAKTNDALELAVPATVNVAMNEIAADMREGLLALAVGAGLQVMGALMDADVAALAGPRGRHDPDRTATRHGTEAGSVTLGGRRVSVTRPRVRAVDGTGELAVPSYELFSSTEILGKMAMERMLAGLSTRRYRVGLEPVGEQVSGSASSTSKSAVSRKFVAMTEHALGDLLAADLSTLDLVAFMVDGVHFAESCAPSAIMGLIWRQSSSCVRFRCTIAAVIGRIKPEVSFRWLSNHKSGGGASWSSAPATSAGRPSSSTCWEGSSPASASR